MSDEPVADAIRDLHRFLEERGRPDRLPPLDPRVMPHRMGIGPFLKPLLMNAPPERVRYVPVGKVELSLGPNPIVNCPCSNLATVEIEKDRLVKCSNCERYYLQYGIRILVLYGEMELPPLPPPDEVVD